MKNVKNNNGITLMALVITIIILIILASIGIYSGIQVVKSSQFTAFSTELKIMQTQVNKLYEKKKNNEKILLNNVETDIEDIGTAISSSSEVQTQANKAFNASGITDTPDYKYFDNTTIKNLNIEGVEGEFFVNIDKRSVVSYYGFEYEGKTYYTLEQLPDGLYNVEHNTSEQQPDFNVDYELLENGKCKISVNNINYNGNINKWKVKYKNEGDIEWNQVNSYSFIIDEPGNYRVKIANNNIESREKQIMAKTLPNEYQQVEYIGSTGTQWIDTGVKLNNNSGVDINAKLTATSGKKSYYLFGSSFDQKRYMIAVGGTTDKYLVDFNSNSYRINSSVSAFDNVFHIHRINNLNYYIDNILQGSQTSLIFSNTENAYLFDAIGRSTANYVGIQAWEVKYCRIYDNGTLVRQFIPCYRKADNVVGMFDIVEEKFYTNQGTGAFYISTQEYSLPSEYQQVEYIGSTGTQWIDTGVKLNNNSGVDINAKLTATSGKKSYYLFGSSFDQKRYMIAVGGTTDKYLVDFNSTDYRISSSVSAFDGLFHIHRINNLNYYIDNILQGSQTSLTFSNTENAYLFDAIGRSTANNVGIQTWEIKYCKIYDNGTLVRQFIPCYRKLDNVVGMFDIVEGRFYTNQGTGDFEKGDDVIASNNTNNDMIIIINDL